MVFAAFECPATQNAGIGTPAGAAVTAQVYVRHASPAGSAPRTE